MSPTAPDSASRPPSPTILQRAARATLAALGWRVEVTWPPEPRCIIIVYPHTSNWDFGIGYLAKLAIGLPVSWIGKDTLFRWPVAGVLRRMGGLPVNRRESTGLVGQLARELEQHQRFWLAIAPEGTRAHQDHLKSGFYQLALATGVPVGLAFIDYRERVVGLERYVRMTGDADADLAALRAAYSSKRGKHADQASDIRFRGRP
ncbi:MAG TPA: 1-acyl-sn-glycerol-3-phosphate acyltransferase [Anaeromyxobacteraceae bacterium]|nr:1-acyl-sn-glycerol-3-phosphate acyltransferase [Anaeromyxobacteraceae bacterium]